MTSDFENKGKTNKRAILGFGEIVEGYNMPVLNEREVRAAAGIMFLGMLLSFMLIIFRDNFQPIKYVIILFLVDFIIRVFINPKYSPTLIVGRFIVGRQTPEYVGAKQKKFAWSIGLFLASIMFVIMVIANSYSPISGITCMICLVFMFFESAFGICLGCLFYDRIYKEKAEYCPGEICKTKVKQDIQKLSFAQAFIVVGYIALISVTGYYFNDSLSQKPDDLRVVIKSKLSIDKTK